MASQQSNRVNGAEVDLFEERFLAAMDGSNANKANNSCHPDSLLRHNNAFSIPADTSSFFNHTMKLDDEIGQGGGESVANLEERIRELEWQLLVEKRNNAQAQEHSREDHRRISELTSQAAEDRERMQGLVDKLQKQVKAYEEQAEIAAQDPEKIWKELADLYGISEIPPNTAD